MPGPIRVFVYSADEIVQVGISSQLRGQPEVVVVGGAEVDTASVAVIATDDIDEAALQAIRAVQRNGCPRVVLVAGRADDGGLVAAVEAGACGLLRRTDATPSALAAAVRSAVAGDGTVPPDLLGRLLTQVGRVQRHVLVPRGLTFNGLTEREVHVLRLVADGLGTAEIARQLSYSERTIKNVIHDVTMRLGVRSRAHAVAFAVRQGLI